MISTKPEQPQQIKDFISVCNEFISGKFIMADIKISKILRAISNSKDLYNLIAEYMINYDFESDYKKICQTCLENQTQFELPQESYKIVPFVFCLLVELDSKKIDFNDFLSKSFPTCANQNDEYTYFSKFIIVPFKNAVAEIFEMETVETEQEKLISEQVKDLSQPKEDVISLKQKEFEEKEKMDEENMRTVIISQTMLNPQQVVDEIKEQQKEDDAVLLFNRIVRITRILEDKLVFIKNPLKKSNIELIVEAMYDACEYENVKIIVALIMSLNNIAGNEKHVREELKELNTICYEFYE